jgi:hypothetical protein
VGESDNLLWGDWLYKFYKADFQSQIDSVYKGNRSLEKPMPKNLQKWRNVIPK